MPVTMAQVRNRTDEQGTAKIVAYTYQSYDNGRIPPEHDVVDLFAQDSVQTALLQHEAREAIQCMVQHGEFQPYVTAEEAERRARTCAERLSRLPWCPLKPWERRQWRTQWPLCDCRVGCQPWVRRILIWALIFILRLADRVAAITWA